MGAICGHISYGRPPARDALGPVLERLAFRGPDGSRTWAGERVMLGHCLLATTPEAELEVQPWRHPESGCVITADARLDNREELAAALSIGLRERTFGDAELILRAWLRWGEDAPGRLLGDFAFAIWEPRSRRLFCARDQMGMRQLIWGMPRPDALVFATDARAVHAAAPDRFPLNEARIADVLEDLEGIDLEVTFFKGVSRLPPAHRLTFDPAGIRIDRYWTLERPPLRGRRPEHDHERGFLDVFQQAVRARLRSNRPVASMLSGGMDSTSVAAIAAELLASEGRGPLLTVSAVGPDPETCPETRGAHAAWKMPGIEPHAVDHTRLDDLMPILVDQFRNMIEPFDAGMNLPRAVYLRSAELGARVVLDGVSSDTIFQPGDHRVGLLRNGRIGATWRDIRGERAFWSGERPLSSYLLAAAAWRAFAPEPVKALRRNVVSRFRRAQPVETSVSAALADRVNLAERRARMAAAGRHHGPRLDAILHPNLFVARERYDRVAAQSGIEPRDPFMDLRVIDYVLGTPPELLQTDGWPKALLRKAMAGRVPDAVRWRRGRTHLGPLFTDRVLDRMSCESMPGWLASCLAPRAGRNRAEWIERELNARLAALAISGIGEAAGEAQGRE